MLRGMQTLQSNVMLAKHAVLNVALMKVHFMVSCRLGTYKLRSLCTLLHARCTHVNKFAGFGAELRLELGLEMT